MADEGKPSFDELLMREKIEARKRGRAAGVLWASDATRGQRESVLAFGTQEVLDRWIEDDERTAEEAKQARDAADDLLLEASRKLYVAIHGSGSSIADDQEAALRFWCDLAERVGDESPSAFWLGFYAGFVEGVTNEFGHECDERP